ncbi:PAM68 family protein [Geminocystis sp.]|jgi:hypothetical protein|uniref:PAM68 family protein n=1 Tax=Geminocystis sp. TaxID=2664100 RepID=UPI003593168B
MPSSSNRDSLPFEPKKNNKITKKPSHNPLEKSTNLSSKDSQGKKQSTSEAAIPEVISNRMLKRIAIFSGIPTGMGIFTFFASYVVVTQKWLKVPNTAVLLVTMGLFGLGVLGLSYGVLSTSWDEEREGTWWGWSDFTVNFRRFTSAWKNARQESINK